MLAYSYARSRLSRGCIESRRRRSSGQRALWSQKSLGTGAGSLSGTCGRAGRSPDRSDQSPAFHPASSAPRASGHRQYAVDNETPHTRCAVIFNVRAKLRALEDFNVSLNNRVTELENDYLALRKEYDAKFEEL